MEFNDLSPELQVTVKRMVSFCMEKGFCLGMGEGYKYHPVHNEIWVRDDNFKALAAFVDYDDSKVQDNIEAEIEALVENAPQTYCPHCGHAMDRVNDDVYCPNGCVFEPYVKPEELVGYES
jgi:hypothetical protein